MGVADQTLVLRLRWRLPEDKCSSDEEFADLLDDIAWLERSKRRSSLVIRLLLRSGFTESRDALAVNIARSRRIDDCSRTR